MDKHDKAWLILCLAMFLICAILLLKPNCARAQDTTGIDFGKGWRFGLAGIPFGAMIEASQKENTQLEAKPFIGSGISLSISWRKLFGVYGSALFYAMEDEISPMASGGLTMFDNKVAIGPAWDFGKIPGNLPSWQERLKFMISYNLLSLGK